MRNIAKILGALVLVLGATVLLTPVVHFKGSTVLAHMVPSPCDFTTGGGWILIPNGTAFGDASLPESGAKANFGLVGGCKNGGFFGHVNYVDHNNGLHVSSTEILGYFDPTPPSKIRDICGTARTNLLGNVFFRVRTIDAEQQPTPPPKDKFGIKLIGQNPDGSSSGQARYIVEVRCLADGRPAFFLGACGNVNPGGGDIELHKPNRSTTGPSVPPSEFQACGGDDSGLFE